MFLKTYQHAFTDGDAYKRQPGGTITYGMEGADAPTDLSADNVRKTLLQRITNIAGDGEVQTATAHLISRYYAGLLAQARNPQNGLGASKISLSEADLEECELCLLNGTLEFVAEIEAEMGEFRARSPHFTTGNIEYSTDNDIFPTVEDWYSITILREGTGLRIDFEWDKKNDGQQQKDESGGESMAAAFTDLCS